MTYQNQHRQDQDPSGQQEGFVLTAQTLFASAVLIPLLLFFVSGCQTQTPEKSSPTSMSRTVVSSGRDYANPDSSPLVVEDTVISPGDPTTNLNGARLLSIGGELQHRMHYGRILLRFDVSSLRKRLKKVTSAQIILNPNWARISPTLQFFPITERDGDWSITEATWKEKRSGRPWTGGDGGGKPGEGTIAKAPVATATPNTDGDITTCDIPASLVNEWMAGDNPGLLVKMNQQRGGVGLYAAEAGEKGPRLKVKGIAAETE